jgi:hypothetical protein
MGTAYLQRVFEHLGAALLDELDSYAHPVEELREYEPEIRLLVKLPSAIETDLAVQPPDAGQQAVPFPHSVKGKWLDTKLAAGKRDLLAKRWMANA